MKMTSRFRYGLITFLVAGPALATTNIAIIDSGVDYKHKDLTKVMWHETGTDADHPNDTNGWNFADNNNEVIDYSFLGTFPADDTKYFEIQGRMLLGTASPDEVTWEKSKRGDATFIQSLETFGNFVHGTHVTGISTSGNPNARAIPIKMIATKPPQQSYAPLRRPLDGNNDIMIEFYLQMAANNNLQLVQKTAEYANTKGARVGNCSFGASMAEIKPAVKNMLTQIDDGKAPSDADVTKWSLYLLKQLIDGTKQVTDAAPNMLFVIAAGNDGTDNDSTPTWPANGKEDNTIAVAATLGTASLATFSNYGATMVEVAAPGVAIKSTIPGDQYLPLSGTSMAAPFVTDVAGLIADANAALTPAQVKQTLMNTVDVKDFLRGKVKTSGIVNKQRAVYAARLSASMPLDEAIAQANIRVGDAPLDETYGAADQELLTPVALPNPVHL